MKTPRYLLPLALTAALAVSCAPNQSSEGQRPLRKILNDVAAACSGIVAPNQAVACREVVDAGEELNATIRAQDSCAERNGWGAETQCDDPSEILQQREKLRAALDRFNAGQILLLVQTCSLNQNVWHSVFLKS